MIFITIQEIIDDRTKIIQQCGGLAGIRDIGLCFSNGYAESHHVWRRPPSNNF